MIEVMDVTKVRMSLLWIEKTLGLLSLMEK